MSGILGPLRSLALSDAAKRSHDELAARWGKLIAWGGGTPEALKSKVPGKGVAASVDHWIAFDRAWQDGDPDETDLPAVRADLGFTEATAAGKGYGVPPEPLPAAPGAVEANRIVQAAEKVDEASKALPIPRALTDPSKGGPFSGAAWGALWHGTPGEIKIGGAVLLVALGLGFGYAVAPKRRRRGA